MTEAHSPQGQRGQNAIDERDQELRFNDFPEGEEELSAEVLQFVIERTDLAISEFVGERMNSLLSRLKNKLSTSAITRWVPHWLMSVIDLTRKPKP